LKVNVVIVLRRVKPLPLTATTDPDTAEEGLNAIAGAGIVKTALALSDAASLPVALTK